MIFDVVGKSPYARSLACLVPGGRYLLANHGLTVMLRGVLSTRLGDKKVRSELASPTRRDLDHLAALMAAGKIRAVIDRSYPLDQVAEAHRFIETGTRRGHVLLCTGAATPRAGRSGSRRSPSR